MAAVNGQPSMSDTRMPAQHPTPPDGTDAARAVPAVPGHSLTRLLGRSATASTWLGTQRSMDRTVAIKVLELHDEATRQRFESALRAASRISHPAIASIHLIGRTTDGRVFYTTPCLPDDLRAPGSLQHKPLRIAALLRTLLVALGYAHRHGIVHGGVKPSNLRLDEQGRVQLCDFGLALAAHDSGMPLSSAAASWMSPDQVRGDAPDADDDLYALAIVAWDLLTGNVPFQGNDALSIAMAHVQQPVPRLPAMLRAWQGWMDKALAKTPAERFQNAREMAQALANIDGKHDAELPERTTASTSWRRWTIGAAAVAGVALVVAGAWALLAQPQAATPTQHNVIGPPPAHVAVVATPAASLALAPAAPATTSLAGRVQSLVEQGDTLRAQGRLITSSSNDAITAYLTALNLDPGNANAIAGINAILASQQRNVDAAWHGNELNQLPALLAHADLAAAHASARARRAWHAARARLADDVGAAVVMAANNRDSRQLAALKPIATTLPANYPPGFDMATAESRATALRAGDRLRDPSGPALVYVPASGNAPAFALARVEVTRADYAAFVHATHRPVSTCVVAYNLFSRLRHLDWQAPGFAQGPNHPVVCISHQDAAAYTAWLSQTTGQPYRLPTANQWLRAAQGAPAEGPCRLGNIDDASRHGGLDADRRKCDDGAAFTAPVGHYAASGVGAYDMYGNVSEWLAGGGGRATFRGLSWRSGNQQTALAPPGETSADLGYDSIGFRVLRVIDAAHPAPPRVDSN